MSDDVSGDLGSASVDDEGERMREPDALPTVTVVIPAYRRVDRLRVCLTALARQDYPRERLEVVVVDDGSPDPLAVVAPEFDGRLRLTVHRQANAGPAVARNAGAALAAGELLAFTDDDCAPEPGWVRALAAASAAAPGAIIGGRTVNALPRQPAAEASQVLLDFLYEWFADDAASRFFASNNLAAPTRDFVALDGFDTTFPRPGGEDRELCERWGRSGRPLVEAPDAVVRHFHGMGVRGFCRQHWNYGRGAYDVHRRRLSAGEPRVRVEPAGFYAAIVARPFGRYRPLPAARLSALLTLSQAVNAAGFFWERRQQAAARRTSNRKAQT